MSILLKQHLNTHKHQLRTLGLQIIIHHTHAPVSFGRNIRYATARRGCLWLFDYRLSIKDS
jgi:hypothetical protein